MGGRALYQLLHGSLPPTQAEEQVLPSEVASSRTSEGEGWKAVSHSFFLRRRRWAATSTSLNSAYSTTLGMPYGHAT